MTGKNLIFITGPAGCGKTINGPKLADYFGCKHTIDGIDSSAIARLLNMLEDGEKVLVLSSQSAGVIRHAFPDSSIHNFFDAMREARLVVAPQWRLDVEATRAGNQKEFAAIPNGPTLAVLGEIQGERARQVAKGFDSSSDDRYTENEMALAAYAYIDCSCLPIDSKKVPWVYPWHHSTFRNEGLRANLVKAAALLVAEIERLDRVKPVAAEVYIGEKLVIGHAGDFSKCDKAPAGYQCTRLAGHDGPCAAVDTNTAGEP